MTRFKESKFVEHQGLKCCELRGHGVLQGGVGVVHVVERFLESGVLCFKGGDGVANIINLCSKVLMTSINRSDDNVRNRGCGLCVFAQQST